MPGSMGAGEAGDHLPSVDRIMSTDELHHQIDWLMHREKVPSSRMKILLTLASACGSSGSKLRILTETLACWEEQRYAGAEALEWRTCIIQAAGNTAGTIKEIVESFVLLCVKANTWCTQIVPADLQETFSEKELPIGGLLKIERELLLLNIAILEGMVDKYSPTEPLRLEERLAHDLENLIISSFEIVKVFYLSSMKRPSLQSRDDEDLRKKCHELLSLTFRLVYTFRRHLESNSLSVSGLSQRGSIEDLGSSGWQPQLTAIRIVRSSIKSFTELGDLSTKGGLTSLGLLNISWKSITALLQVEEGREAVASVVDITHIISSLLHHAAHALKLAVQSWLLSVNSGEKDSRRLCIPIKFFLQMAEKVTSFYPEKAIMASKSLVSCVSKIYASLLLHYKDAFVQKTALQVLAELVVPTAVDVLHNLLVSRSIEAANKVQLLRTITSDDDDLESFHSITDLDGGQEDDETLDELFNDKPTGLGLLKTGRLALFLSLLQLSRQYETALLLEMTSKLQWLLEAVPEQGVYVVLTQARLLPMSSAEGKLTWKFQLTFSWMSLALQAFAGFAAREEPIWTELQYFLFENVLHPCATCRELVLDLWCFIIRQSDASSAQRHIDLLLSLLQDLGAAKKDSTLMRRVARVLCTLLEEAPEAVAARIHAVVFEENPFTSEFQANVATVLLEEGYSLALLNDGMRKESLDRLMTYCIGGGKDILKGLELHDSDPSMFTPQKQALTCLQLLLCESAFRGDEVEDVLMQEIHDIAQDLLLRHTQEDVMFPDSQSADLVSRALSLIPHVQHLLKPSFIQTLLSKLHDCCKSAAQNSCSQELKQALPEFLANLSEIALTEQEDNPAIKALWGLYHLVLRERHWALVHMGLASFSHYASHTTCQELWRFVPQDAALALKRNSVEDSSGDLFMSALKAFIEKEGAQNSLVILDEELVLLKNEGALIHKSTPGTDWRHDSPELEQMDTDQVSRDRREILQALDMIWNGIAVLKDRVPSLLAASHGAAQQWQSISTRLAEFNEAVRALQKLK